ncbi:hypothetical protein [Luteimonas aquatica]|uniref:hypothetical protein n=1 Tax=Luteimonas aquatica TaxID=450364 RepID=UPI001F56FD88|nr:hypothetical protein [Luteimonas aquatica]
MNTAARTATPPSAPARSEPQAAGIRRDSRPRDFGIGYFGIRYGGSSGYASARRYASQWGSARFEFC